MFLSHVFADVTIGTGSTLPGAATLQDFVNGISSFALLGCLAAAIIGGVLWAFGAASSNPVSASKGQKTVGGAVVGALVIGAAVILVNFFYHTGQALH